VKTLELADYRHCEAALKLPQLKQALYDDGAILMDRVLVTLHGEEHRSRRMTEMRVFRRDFFKRYEQEVIPGVFSDVMRHVEPEAVDLVDLGYRFMVYLALAFAGIDRQTQTQTELATLVDMLRMFGVAATLGQAKQRDKAATTEAVRATLVQFDRQFFTPSVARRLKLIEQVRGGSSDPASLPMDVLTVLLQNEDQLDLLRDMVLRETAFYFLAGAHTSVHSLSHCVHHLLQWIDAHPQARAQLVSDPLLVQRFVHESFRLHPSSPVSRRRALERVELPDGRIAQRGDIVIINLRLANRDPEIFGAGADEFDPYRSVTRGVAETGITFGIGMHACLGKNLAAGSLPAPGKSVDPASHQFGTVAWIAHALLREGVTGLPGAEPQLDQAIARETWLTYPVRMAGA
jgi:cytochrome P450